MVKFLSFVSFFLDLLFFKNCSVMNAKSPNSNLLAMGFNFLFIQEWLPDRKFETCCCQRSVWLLLECFRSRVIFFCMIYFPSHNEDYFF